MEYLLLLAVSVEVEVGRWSVNWILDIGFGYSHLCCGERQTSTMTSTDDSYTWKRRENAWKL